MTMTADAKLRPAADADHREASQYRRRGIALAPVGFLIVLGEFRKGGGEVQELVTPEVRTLKMPGMAKIFILGMALGMMTLLVASIIHLVVAGQVATGSISLNRGETAAINPEAVRRLGVAVYLVAITFGLATIIRVLRFQAIRLREIAS